MMTNLTEGIRRAVSAMVRSLGAAEVVLRIPAPPVAGDAGEELGLRSPEFQTKLLRPVAVRRQNESLQVLVAADALETLLAVQDSGAVEAVMQTVTAVAINDQIFALAGVESIDMMGRACLYRLLLQRQALEVA